MRRLFAQSRDSRRRSLLAARAQGMRSSPTLSEARLWRELSGEKLGVAFRRQVTVGRRFIADFLAPSLKLVVEVDGGVHEHRRRADARRDERLRRLGYVVLRVEAEVVMRDIGWAVEVVRAAIETLR